MLLATTEGVDEHDTGPHHPERPARLAAALGGLEAAGLQGALAAVAARPATDAELALVHDLDHVRALERFAEAGGGRVDMDTVVSSGSMATARRAVGAGLAAIEAVRAGEGDAAFVVTRPPGHHASADRAMGFCLLNSIAVGAAALAEAGERVVIVDWDVHHGNGTQEVFWDDPRVLYVSTHQWPFWPYTGHAAEVGGAAAWGTTLNVPLPAGATGDAVRRAVDEVIAPAVEAFAPTWLLVSAGFDAHRDDPLAGLRWTAGDYADLVVRLREATPGAPVVAYLEGGYDLDALGRCSAAVVGALAGARFEGEAPSAGGPGAAEVERAALERARALAAGPG